MTAWHAASSHGDHPRGLHLPALRREWVAALVAVAGVVLILVVGWLAMQAFQATGPFEEVGPPQPTLAPPPEPVD